MDDILHVPAEEILKQQPMLEAKVERIAYRKVKTPIAIIPYDSQWPLQYEVLRDKIQMALGPTALYIAHVGSTSVPGLPAKAIIDIDVVVKDITDEEEYVPALEKGGFQFLLREPEWYKHRFFISTDLDLPCNLHVFPPNCAEIARHRIFRDWLRRHDEDRDLYAKAKMAAAEATTKAGETLVEYTKRKEDVIQQILQRAFKELGYVE